jgi:type IV pilus assembly protein PilQ
MILSNIIKIISRLVFILFIIVNPVEIVFSQDSTRIDSISNKKSFNDSVHYNIPENALENINLLDFKNTEIKDIVRGLATKYNLNIFIDDAIAQRVTLRLTNISVHEALWFVVKENGLEMKMDGSIYKIFLPEIPIPKPKPLIVMYKNGLLTVDLKNEDLEKVVYTISEVSKKNIMLNRGVEGKISGFLQDIPFEQGLITLMKSNGFIVREKEDIYVIEKERFKQREKGKKTSGAFWIDVQDSLITLDVVDADLNQIIHEIATQLEIDVFILSELKGKVTAQCSGVPLESVLDYLLKATNYTYRREGSIYLFGDKSVSGIASTQLIRLNHIKAEGIIDILPPSVKSKATLQVIKEHNALMVVAARDVIRETEKFIREIDYPVPQILIEAIVVDFNTSNIAELGVTAGMKSDTSNNMLLDHGLLFPTLDFKASGSFINDGVEIHGPKFGIKNLGKLPENFYMGLKALESQGKANVRSRPQIATLNGHPASIKIGTTQYYQLETHMPFSGGNNVFQQTSQRFEKIVAEISLEITPWVSASGEITTEIKPEFSTPRQFDPKIPPTIDHRILNSTIRLRDGETVVLGGLTREQNDETVTKLPILGDIPILGLLFRTRSYNRSKAELMIYITPHLTYSDDIRAYSRGIIK